MPGLVESGVLLLGSSHDGRFFSLQATDNAVNSLEEVFLENDTVILSSRRQSCFIADIGYVRTGESRGMLGHKFKIEIPSQLDVLEVDFENFLPLLELRQFYMDLTVETSRPHESLIQNISSVGRRENDDS